MTDSEIPFGDGDPIVDLQLSKLIDEAEHDLFTVAQIQRRNTLRKGYPGRTRDGAGFDELGLAAGALYALRALAASVAPGVLAERTLAGPIEVRERGRLAADEEAGLIPDMAQEDHRGA